MSPVRRVLMRVALSSLLVPGMLLTCLAEASWADFTYAWTELSLEWITDASGAIAQGKVTDVDKDGQFTLRVDRVLKRASGFSLDTGDVIKGSCLGRSTLSEEGARQIHLLLGRPHYYEPSTHPGNQGAIPRKVLPSLVREPNWGKGDECIVFFGQDVKSIVQIVNVDRPLKWQTGDQKGKPFLVADINAKIIAVRDKLLDRIKRRVADGHRKTSDGSAKVDWQGYSRWPDYSELDAQDFFYVFIPPDLREEVDKSDRGAADQGSEADVEEEVELDDSPGP